ncbi:general odorant-binding protein 67-like [Drosophila nasuta]|uniref:general odorant-binding protein 67-like n=1 Tax=Drosophila nasuta TaxID=42062 RepID=UPI00295EC681|nr:general odorant-binding protein 67-like [Drosophila nasuta]
MLSIVLLGLFLVVVSADVDCSKRPKLMNPRTCCPLPEFISDDLKQKCMEYNVAPNGELIVDNTRLHQPSPCFISCVFNKIGVYENQKVYIDKLNDYVQVQFKDNSEMQNLAIDSFTTCGSKISEFKDMKGDFPSLCSWTQAFLVVCVYNEMLKNCPATLWSNTQDCNDAREYFANCKPSNN